MSGSRDSGQSSDCSLAKAHAKSVRNAHEFRTENPFKAMSQHNAYLNQILQSISQSELSHDVKQQAEKYRTEVMDVLRQQLDGTTLRAGNPVPAGSWTKNTEVNFQFDFDLVLPFRQGGLAGDSGLNKLKDMRKKVQTALENHYRHKPFVTVRAQRFSTGVHFDNNGRRYEIDVVPGMEASAGSYRENGPEEAKDLLLYNRTNDTLLRTNVHRQIRIIRNLGPWREIIRLLKAWNKRKNDGNISSYAIELMVKMASETAEGKAAKDLGDRLEYMLGWLSQFLAQPNPQLTDVGSGNQWVYFVKPKENENLANRFANMLKDLMGERAATKVKAHFPLG